MLDRTDALLLERRARENRLAALDVARSAGERVPLECCFERAQLLDALGRTELARAAYLEVLAGDDSHAGALNALGRLLDRTGFGRAARTAYERAVHTHPSDPVGHGNLAGSLLDSGDIRGAKRHYECAVRLDPQHIVAHACLAIVHLRLGDAATAAAHARIGFRAGPTAWPYRGDRPPIRVGIIRSALGGNVPIDRFIDDDTYAKWTLVAEFADPAQPLPAHAFIVNAIGDADRCAAGLRTAAAIVERTTAPVINAPRAVLATSRRSNAERFAALPGVLMPQTALRSRAALTARDGPAELERAGFGWPVIVRAPGFQTGRHCTLIGRPHDLAAAVAELPGDEFLVIEFVDLRQADGTYAKYRVMVIGGIVRPLHLAVSRHWMVHYFSADMAERADARAAEAAFLTDYQAVLGGAATAALALVARELSVDYGGIDFGLDRAGRIVVFEANATMIVTPPAAAACWAYRREPIARVERAVRALLAAAGAPPSRAEPMPPPFEAPGRR